MSLAPTMQRSGTRPSAWPPALECGARTTVTDVVEIIVVLGEPECAAHILDFYCRAAASGGWALLPDLTVRRERALIAAVGGDPWGALTILEGETARALVDSGSAEEVGRTLVVRGGLRLMHGLVEGARADLTRAVDILSAHSAVGWADAAFRALVSTAQPERWRSYPGDAEERAARLTGWYWDHAEIAAGLRRALTQIDIALELSGLAPTTSRVAT